MDGSDFDAINPVVLAAFYWTNTYSHLPHSDTKHSYTYRIMYVLEGRIRVETDYGSFLCKPGSLLYLVPGLNYKTIFLDSKFRILHLFFDLVRGRDACEVEKFPEFGVFSCGAVGIVPSAAVRFARPEAFNSAFLLPSFTRGVGLLENCLREFTERRIYYRLQSDAHLTALLIELARSLESGTAADPPGHVRTVDRIIRYINEHFKEKLTCADVSRTFNYHPNYLNQIMRAATGMTLHAYILDTKIRHATFLLDETDMSITEIAYALSFCDSSHFCHAYLESTGKKPTERRKAIG